MHLHHPFTHFSVHLDDESMSEERNTHYIPSFRNSQRATSVIEAETYWSMFCTNHSDAFLASNYAMNIFSRMFMESNLHVFE